MAIYAIFDNNIGFLQWLGEAQSKTQAFDKHKDEIGGDFKDSTIDCVSIHDVTAAEAKALQEWADNGSPSDEWPLDWKLRTD